jgi:hypothetical protein
MEFVDRKDMTMASIRRIAVGCTALAGAIAVGGIAAPAWAGVENPGFYADGQVYRTVGTPTDLSGTGAPAQAWDVIYDFGGAQLNVATAAPGDAGYTGGRWQVHALGFPAGYPAALAAGDRNGNGVLDSGTEVNAALAAGAATDLGVVKQFECPVIPVGGAH